MSESEYSSPGFFLRNVVIDRRSKTYRIEGVDQPEMSYTDFTISDDRNMVTFVNHLAGSIRVVKSIKCDVITVISVASNKKEKAVSIKLSKKELSYLLTGAYLGYREYKDAPNEWPYPPMEIAEEFSLEAYRTYLKVKEAYELAEDEGDGIVN